MRSLAAVRVTGAVMLLYWGDGSYRGPTEVNAIDSAKLDGAAINYNVVTGLKQLPFVSAADGGGPPA